MRKKVLLSAPYMMSEVERFRKILEGYGLEVVVPDVKERLEEDQLLDLIVDIDGVICGDDRFTNTVLEKASRLKVISKWGTGIDSIDQEACRANGVIVCNTPGAFTEPVSDSVMAYILSFARNILVMDAVMKRGAWEKVKGRSLRECTLGVIGVGAIGSAVCKRARGFGMTILGNDIRDIDPALLESLEIKMTSLPELLCNSDYVVVSCTLNPSSFHLLDTPAFETVKPGAVIVNCARGPVIDEQALIHALETGKVSGAGLDVFEEEPLPLNSPLLKMDNVLLAPHNSNSSPAAYERVHENTINNLIKHLEVIR